jgi:hypothetical protein
VVHGHDGEWLRYRNRYDRCRDNRSPARTALDLHTEESTIENMRYTFAVLSMLTLAYAVVCPRVASAAPGATIFQKQPSPGAHLTTYFPILSASVEHANARSLHLFLDGRDVTASASIQRDGVRYVPRARVAAGWHDVFLQGTGANHRHFSDSWVFETQSPDGAMETTSTMDGFEFFPSGGSTFFPGSFMHFFLIAPSDGFAVLQLCGFGQFPFQHQPFSPVFFVTVPVPALTFNPFLNCQVAALFTPINGFGNVLVPLPVEIGFFSNHRHTVVTTPPAVTYGTTAPRATMPIQSAPELPGAVSPTIPISTGRTTMPTYRVIPMPNAGTSAVPRTMLPISHAAPGTRPVAVPRPVAIPHAVGIPHGAVVPHPAAVPIPH